MYNKFVVYLILCIYLYLGDIFHKLLSTIFYHILTKSFMEKLTKKDPQYCMRDSRTQIEQTKGKCDAAQRRVVIVETTIQLNEHKMQNPHGASNDVLKVSYCAEFTVPIFSIIIWKTRFYNRNRHRRCQEKLNLVQTDGIHIKNKTKKANVLTLYSNI